jgi:hypothetical protein
MGPFRTSDNKASAPRAAASVAKAPITLRVSATVDSTGSENSLLLAICL